MKTSLFLVPTPIGNYEDITLRALTVLREVSFIICEEYKEARRFLSHFKIEKELISLNEHNEDEISKEILLRLINGESAALISDCGTPLFSDPGHILLDYCIPNNIKIIPLPGANSLTPALSASGLRIEKFYYYGWLSPKKDERKQQIFHLSKRKEVLVLLDTPYRLKTLLNDVINGFGKQINIVLAYQISMKEEYFFRGTAQSALTYVEKNNLKGEFVLIIDNRY